MAQAAAICGANTSPFFTAEITETAEVEQWGFLHDLGILRGRLSSDCDQL
jgi:hypothetical protein